MINGHHKMSKEMIGEVIRMRQEGHSTVEIGRIFNRDHTTITYHCQKAGISVITTKIRREKIARTVKREEFKEQLKREAIAPTFISEDAEVVNREKNYADYVKEEKQRNWSKRADVAPKPILEYPQSV